MNIAIVVNKYYQTPQTRAVTARIFEAFASYKVSCTVVGNDLFAVGLGALPDCDGVVFWDKDILLAQYFQSKGIPVFNCPQAIADCDDKALTYLRLTASGVAVPPTVVAPFCFANIGYADFDFVDSAAAVLGYPMVIKPRVGSLGMGVALVNNREQAEKVLTDNVAVGSILQRFVSESRGTDVRVTVVGGKAICAIRRTNEKDFRSNVEQGGKGTVHMLTAEERKVAEEAAIALRLDYCGVDIVDTKSGPAVLEVNSNAFFLETERVSGCKVAECYARYIIDQIKGGENEEKVRV